MPPWGLFYAYRIIVLQLSTRDEDSNTLNVTVALKEALEKLDARWNAAGEFFLSCFSWYGGQVR